MEPPYGECNASNPVPMANCQVNCRTRMIVGECGCRDLYMQNLTDGKPCHLSHPHTLIPSYPLTLPHPLTPSFPHTIVGECGCRDLYMQNLTDGKQHAYIQ
jgi:hypothetical protein